MTTQSAIWKNLLNRTKPAAEVRRNIRRGMIADSKPWVKCQYYNGECKHDECVRASRKVAIPAIPLPLKELEQLRGQVNFLNNKVMEMRAIKTQEIREKADWK